MTVKNEKKLDLHDLESIALLATQGPWVGDRDDGTIKYDLVGKDGEIVIHGVYGSSDNGAYGIQSEEDEKYLLTFHPATVLKLIEMARKAGYE